MTKISAFIICKNESARIATAISSVIKMVDEVIVIDSHSSDNTAEIARELGARVVTNSWPGYVKQKAFGESLCSYDWLLNIDADEELSPKLQAEIAGLFMCQPSYYLAYRINFVILHRNDVKPRFLAPANKFIRLYNRHFSSFANVPSSNTTHDAVLLNPGTQRSKVADLSAVAYHKSGTSIEQLVSKANFYSSEQAQDLARLNRTPSKIRIGSELFWWFLKAFILRRYFVFGFDGFVDSIIFAFARFIRLAKARELHNKRR